MATEDLQPSSDAMQAVEPVAKKMQKKEKVKRTEKPERQVMEEQIAKLQAQSETCHGRIQEIKSIIDSKRDGRKNGSATGQAARARLNELRAASKASLDAKQAIRQELVAVDAARDSLREETKSIKENLAFVKLEQIDEEIRKLEHRISHTTMAIDEERKAVSQIEQLRKSREMVKLYNDRLEKLQEDDSVRRAISDRIKEQDNVINQNKAVEAKQKEVMDAIREAEDAQVADIPELANERNESYEFIREARDTVRNLRNEFKQKEDEYYANERLWRTQQKDEKQKIWEASQAERDERTKQRKEWEAENAPEPFDKEVTACEQLIGYLSKYTVATVAAPAAASSSQQEVQVDGMRALKKDDWNDSDAMFTGLGGGKKKGGKGGGKKTVKVEALKHMLDVISNYGLLKLTAPSTKEAVAGSAEELKEKKAHFLKKRVEAKEKKAREEEEEALAPKETLGKDRKFTRGKKERRGKPVVTVTLTVNDEKVSVVLTLPEKKEKGEEEQVKEEPTPAEAQADL